MWLLECQNEPIMCIESKREMGAIYKPILELIEFPGYYVTSSGEILHIVNRRLIPVRSHTVANSNNAYIHLEKDGKLFHRAMDKLILEAYIGKHDKYNCVRYADGNTDNRSIDNLFWAPYKLCKTCICYGEKCVAYKGCAVAAAKKCKSKEPSQSRINRMERMIRIAQIANKLDITKVKPSLVDIVNELKNGELPQSVHSALVARGHSFSIQYIYKVMKMLESDDKGLYI